MKPVIAKILLFTLALLAATVATADTIYTWIDENGVRHMTNIPPVQPLEKLDVMELEPPLITKSYNFV